MLRMFYVSSYSNFSGVHIMTLSWNCFTHLFHWIHHKISIFPYPINYTHAFLQTIIIYNSSQLFNFPTKCFVIELYQINYFFCLSSHYYLWRFHICACKTCCSDVSGKMYKLRFIIILIFLCPLLHLLHYLLYFSLL